MLAPVADAASVNTPFDKLADSYDIVVAGAGTGGWAAAVQAARLGAKVLLLEESDWIGGQMAAAAVASMDEEGLWEKFPVRERGLYREFNESMVNFYYTLNKDPFSAYYAWPKQLEGGYEPKIVRRVLAAFIAQARKLDLSTESKVAAVRKDGNTVTGVTIEHFDGEKAVKKSIACKVLIDATEYGDVIPLTGARYRVGHSKSDNLDMASPVQDDTWTAVIREYPEGVPDHLLIKEKPPEYDEKMAKRYRGSQLYGAFVWGGAGKDVKGPRIWRVYFAWRGMADSDSPMTGLPTEMRHTQCGLNGGNDYPASVATIEDPKQRIADERNGINQTLGTIYYFQHELGLPWALAEDEGYNTPYNQRAMAGRGLRPDVEALAKYMPQWPYVRESRRIEGIYTLRASDLGRFEKATLFPTSVAMGDYYMDLHRTEEAIEHDLDTLDYAKGGGPFQVPFEVFIPEKVDGFIPAEKNISQSRLVNGATRLQPITILTGQAAGTIAALAVRQGVQPRALNPIAVQAALLDSGSNLIARWYADVPWGTPIWKASQLLSLYGVMDAPGDFVKGEASSLGGTQHWGVGEPLKTEDFLNAVSALEKLSGKQAPIVSFKGAPAWNTVGPILSQLDPDWKKHLDPAKLSETTPLTRDQFAPVAAGILRDIAQPKLKTNP